MDDLIEKYIAMRDAKDKLRAAHKAKIAQLDAVMDRFEGVILEKFNEEKIQSLSTKSGTAYKQRQTSATVADWDGLLEFIQTNQMWQMLEHRVSKLAVEEFKQSTVTSDTPGGTLPPGISWREEYVINVRRS